MTEEQNVVQTNNPEIALINPPYVSYKTFRNFIETLGVQGIPTHIDNSVMTTMSGTNKTLVIQALKYLGLIDEYGTTRELLRQLVNSQGEDRKKILQNVLKDAYDFLFENNFIANATQQKFHDKFTNFHMTGSTIQKSEIFFIQAAKDAELDISNYIKPTRTTKKPSSSGRKTPNNKQNKTTELQKPAESNDKPKDLPDVSLNTKIVDKMLEKFPQFDPTWSKEAQEDWLRAVNEFYQTIKN